MKKELRILFIGTPYFTLPVLSTLLKESGKRNWVVVGVLTQENKKSGRNQELSVSPVKEMAFRENILCLDPARLSDTAVREQLAEMRLDISVMSAYSKRIPLDMLNFPVYQTVGIHPSLLPAYPGISPVQSALLAGEKETGVTIFKLNETFDTGPILFQKKVSIEKSDTFKSLVERLYGETAVLLPDVIEEYVSGERIPQPQDTSRFVYTQKLSRESGNIDWNMGDEYIERMIRAYYPWPGTWTTWRGKRLKIHAAHLDSSGSLSPDLLQLEGDKTLTIEEFVRGHHDFSVAELRKARN